MELEPAIPHEREVFEASLLAAVSSWRLKLLPGQIDLLYRHYQAVTDTNRVMNLTRVTDPHEAAVKHFADSLSVLAWASAAGRTITNVLDVGTGAGFPAVPLAVMCPQWQVTAIDSTGKKAGFVAATGAALRLPNLAARHARAEEWTPGQGFSLVTARAVAKAAECVSKVGQHVAPGGALVLFASAPPSGEERVRVERSVRRCGLRFLGPFDYDLVVHGPTLRRVLLTWERPAAGVTDKASAKGK
ncbi:MAG: 16S rRNA (guanine(527)-N(7))-methyltransferase RsmG [Planctomycetes bacterium]|nr:16S rRNA (guanine(527)-N(7))-methyltransferase RsmG [Planctomycetota bacterium]